MNWLLTSTSRENMCVDILDITFGLFVQQTNLYHGYLPHFEIFGNGFPEKYIRYLEKFLYLQMTSWAKGTTANSLHSLITVQSFVGSPLTKLFCSRQRTMKFEICFIAHHEWIANCFVCQRVNGKYPTPKTKGTEPSVVYDTVISLWHDTGTEHHFTVVGR